MSENPFPEIDFFVESFDNKLKAGWRASVEGQDHGQAVLLDELLDAQVPATDGDIANIVVFGAADAIATVVLGGEPPWPSDEPSLKELLTFEGHMFQRRLLQDYAKARLEKNGWSDLRTE
jgi:hypothetical protein